MDIRDQRPGGLRMGCVKGGLADFPRKTKILATSVRSRISDRQPVAADLRQYDRRSLVAGDGGQSRAGAVTENRLRRNRLYHLEVDLHAFADNREFAGVKCSFRNMANRIVFERDHTGLLGRALYINVALVGEVLGSG